MIWANNLGILHYYIIIAFAFGYIIYLLRIFLITGKRSEVSIGNILKKLLLRTIYFSLILIAILGPSFGDIKKELKSEGKDIYILLDISLSMNAYDVPPSRLEKAKKEIILLLNNLRYNDRVGIVVFAEDAFIQCPLTFDLNAVKLYLQATKTDLIANQGTDISNALNFTLSKFQQSVNSKNNINSKVIVLISDGEAEYLSTIAQKIKQNNIALFVVGVGTEKGSKIPIHPGFKKDQNGIYIITKLEKEMLSKLASSNNEDFYAINNNYSQIISLADKLNSLEGSVKEVKKIDLSSNKYYYFLAMALFFIIIDGLITVNIIKI